MAVVVSIARGHDASYPFKTIGAADGATITGERGAGYYLSAVEKGGEPAGTWVGDGAATLGFNDGDTVRREDFEPLYGQFLDPRDPTRQAYLGIPPRINAELGAIYRAKLAAHPGATADERMRLLAEARTEYQGPVGVQYFDTTFSVDKTISLAHASALASAVEARQAGDQRAAAEWEARAAGIWAEIETSVRLYVTHMQREAGYVRTGHHGRRINGVETGRFEDAREIPVAIFPQHTSRNGDPQLHVHVLWLNRMQTVRDGQWRAIDSRGLHRNKGAGASLAAFALETGLSHRFGFAWAYRPTSKGRVIAGVPEKAILQFSSRRAQITKTTLALAEEYERERGHAPDQRALASMRQFANARTRKGKEAGPLILDEGSTISMPDLAAVLRHVARSGAKVVITGDHAQLGAVSAGGGMTMLARTMGYAQLIEAVRFRSQWEGSASLAVRGGDVSALAEYDAHGRLHGGSYEEMAEQAVRAYLAEYLAGTDVVLTAFEHRECADLSRRVQDYLLDWGQLQLGASASINDGASAYAGDLIVARQNDNRLAAGEPGRTLANGDLLRVETIGENALTVSRLIRPGRATQQRTAVQRRQPANSQWSAPGRVLRCHLLRSPAARGSGRPVQGQHHSPAARVE